MCDHRGHEVVYCYHCRAKTVKCKRCENVTCTGGYGYLGTRGESYYKVCPDCPDAYELASELGLYVAPEATL